MNHRIKHIALSAAVMLASAVLGLYLYARGFELDQAASVDRKAVPADIAYLKAAGTC